MIQITIQGGKEVIKPLELYRIKFSSRYGDSAISERTYTLAEIEKDPYLNKIKLISPWEAVPNYKLKVINENVKLEKPYYKK